MPRYYLLSVATSLITGCLLINGSTLYAQAKPDDTAVNKRDRATSEKTADQAKDNAADRETMQKIRKAIVADKSLSTYAHNVKIIAEHGKVTLKGPVHSAEEKQRIEAKAVEVVGAENVTNQLTVKGDKPPEKKHS